ncbi:PREDICTED: kinesin-related protein 4-like [Papilio xuthus]|uniref:Kinesin-related protein 4-like n=1 Tax=Papilio xuthus TaxID=66420 RepID=A0AAJ6ZFM8_PAPXU|nr:PREDICTED: kinesin-related protein 4-like [Papilio xuthus]
MDNNTFQDLESEVEFYRQNQAIVEQEIKTLIADNQKLSQQVGILLNEKLQNTQQENNYDKEFEDLKKQVTLLTKERDSLHVLWQTSQKTIDALDKELKTYQIYDNRKYKDNNVEDKRNLELKLETSLNDYVELESKYEKIKREYDAAQNDMKILQKDIQSYKERGKDLEIKINVAEKNLEECKINLAAEKKANEDLRQQLIVSQKESVDRVKREVEAKSKVAEALQLFDVVSAQKNEAYRKIAELTGVINNLRQNISKVKQETENNLRAELDEVKEKCNEKVSDMLEHIRSLDAELVEKGMILNKTLRDNKILQEANEIYIKQEKDNLKSVDPKLALAEQRLEAMFQELVASERRNIQLVCEKQSLAIDIQRIQDIHSRETKRRDWEENLLKTQCDELKLQVDHLQKSLNETHTMITRLQTMLSSRTELNHKMISTKEEELTELNKHLESQMELNRKWKESYIDMTSKLKKNLEALFKENNELRSKLNLPLIRSPKRDEESSSS